MGNRFRGGIKPGAMPWLHKYFGNPGLTAMLNLFFRAGIGDSYCGMRGFSREMYDRLDVRSTGMEFAPELIIKASQLGARISEIPIYLWPDKRGRPPHLRSFRDGWRTLRFFLLYAPNWLFLAAGAIIFLFWAGAGFLAAAGAAPPDFARGAGHAHDGVWGGVHADRGADHRGGIFCQGIQLRRAL